MINRFKIGTEVWYIFNPFEEKDPKFTVVGSVKKPYIDKSGKANAVPEGYDYLILPVNQNQPQDPLPVHSYHLMRT